MFTNETNNNVISENKIGRTNNLVTYIIANYSYVENIYLTDTHVTDKTSYNNVHNDNVIVKDGVHEITTVDNTKMVDHNDTPIQL